MLPGVPIQFTWVGLAVSGLVASVVARWRAKSVEYNQNAAGKRLDELQALTADAFEEWVAARFREQGSAVEVTGAQADHGIDLVVSRTAIRTDR